MRLGLAEFSDYFHHYVNTITSSQVALHTFKTLLKLDDQVSPIECTDVIQCLILMSEQNRKTYNFIKQSDQLPLAVVPLRLPLIMVLLDEYTQISKLKRLLVVLRNEGGTTFDQPIEQRLEIKDELDILLMISNKVLDEVGILLDRARFKEREYSIA